MADYASGYPPYGLSIRAMLASKDMTMLKVFTDFNARTSDDVCWNLKYDDTDLEKMIDDLKLNVGDKVRLFQDENDFEITAVLDYRYVDILQRKAWVAIPDWSTLARKISPD